AQPPDIDEQTRAIASELRCPVCQNLSVADSPAELAQEMRALVREQLQQGKSPEEIKKFFVSKYGDWVLLAPPAKGFGLLLWLLPAVGACVGLLVVFFLLRRWARKRDDAPATASASAQAAVPPAVDLPPDVEGQREFFHHERERLEAERREIEFDFQSGKLSEEDYTAVRRRLENEAAAAGQKLAALPASAPPARKAAPQAKTAAAGEARGWKTWQLATGSVFLLLFGLGLGVLLMQATRQRGSESDSMTGGFLTGTPASGSEALLTQGRAALDRGDFSQAIESFKKVLSADPNNPEALAYMGLILAQAGHADGALSAYDRALAADPNFPIALWGKGILLAQTGGNPAEARRLLEKVSTMMPAGPQKSEVEKMIADLKNPSRASTAAVAATNQKAAPAPAPAQNAGVAIEGVIDVDAKTKPNVDRNAVLFIIAKSTTGAGPPLAVKRIANPKFPLNYSLGAGDVMMPGTPFSGKVFVSARLSKDGNVSTKGPGDLAGEYKKNPIEVGAKKVDFLLEAAR
ncbi:MAG TPA: cytochrome c-type biogenesis protein CcmH, partial [Candidatus Binatia bacterium]|nr:cytochrome c-type biogenesis protein CcmH [Candidatus Binatia bacterium]